MPMTDEQIAKSPKYIRDEVTRLRQEVERLRDELKAQQQQEPTRIKWGWGMLCGEAQGYLRDGETIHFTVPRGRFSSAIRVKLLRDKEGIDINADGTLMIECHSSNGVMIRLSE